MSAPVLAIVVWVGTALALAGLWIALCLRADRHRRRHR